VGCAILEIVVVAAAVGVEIE
jgi:hypothetical protein